MRTILSIVFLVIFGLVGMRLAGPLGKLIVDQARFNGPEQHGSILLMVNIGIAVLCALIGVALGIVLGKPLQRKIIRDI